jgi:hypothetical protein
LRVEVPENLGMPRIQALGKGLQPLYPIRLQLAIEQLLCLGHILDPGEAVILPTVGQPRAIHLVGQPLAAVDADVHIEGKPSLMRACIQPISGSI